jgi:cyclic pyranopterin phosphate synthase
MDPASDRLPQLRVIVNALCGRACFYCRPSGEGLGSSASASLDPDVGLRVGEVYRRLGGTQVKISGGEPAKWKPLVGFVHDLKQTLGFSQVDVLSRDPLFGSIAADLADAGADMLNMSLDSLRPEVHREITGVDDLPAVLRAIEQCVATGLPVKINSVVLDSINSAEIPDLIAYCESIGVKSLKLLDAIRDLHSEHATHQGRLYQLRGCTLPDLYTPLAPIADALRAQSVMTRVVTQGGLGHPMLSLQLRSGLEVIMKDHSAGAWYGSNCTGCRHYPCHDALMALRLTPDARLQFCLLRDDVSIDLRPNLVLPTNGLADMVRRALNIYQAATFRPFEEREQEA